MSDPIRFKIVNAEPETKAEKPPVEVRLAHNSAKGVALRYRDGAGREWTIAAITSKGKLLRFTAAQGDGTSGMCFDDKGRIELEGE